MKEKLTCSHCQKNFERKKGQTRSKRIFCSLQCAGKGKQTTKEDKVKKKAEYDRLFRIKNFDRIKRERAEYHKKTYDKEKAAIHRKTRMPYHVEYCRQPEYKKWKKEYDQQYKSKKHNGEFWESAILINKIADHVDKYQAYLQKGTLNKSQKRKRSWKKLKNSQL